MVPPTRPHPLCHFGHIASYAELLDAFGQESAILPYRMGGRTVRHLRPDVYVCGHLTPTQLSAAWCGGRLDCVTALAEAGVPVVDDQPDRRPAQLHLRLTRGDTRASARRHEHAPTARVHWSRLRTGMPSLAAARFAARAGQPVDRLRVPFRDALRQALTSCLSPQLGAEALDFIVGNGVCPIEDAAHAIDVAPRRVEVALRSLGAISSQLDDALAALRSRHLF